jgi:signal transduction histidine kinase
MITTGLMPRILHIEDDPANRLLVRKLLATSGFDVIDAVDGIDGIRKACAEPPDLVLVDIAIPGLDGYEVTLRLRSEPSMRNVPIVAITAEGNRDTSLSVGCDGYLQKPIDARSFVETIGTYLGGRREQTSPDRARKHLRQQGQRIVSHLENKIAELESANARLVEMDRARKEFYRNVTHELSTPMTPIVGYLKLLRDGDMGPIVPTQEKALRAMDDCVQRLRGIIDNLLDVTGLETGRLRFVHHDYDFGQVVRQAIERHSPAIQERGCGLAFDIPRTGLKGWGDAERLRRAVDHLLDNAVKFTPAGGGVGVRVRRLATGHFELCVVDSGPGISASKLEQLFEPFVQGDGSPTRAHGGTGVGLAIVRGIAQGHGGDVRCASPANETVADVLFTGAGFYFVIPEKAAATAAS